MQNGAAGGERIGRTTQVLSRVNCGSIFASHKGLNGAKLVEVEASVPAALVRTTSTDAYARGHAISRPSRSWRRRHGRASCWRRSMMKSWPLGLRAIAAVIAWSRISSLSDARNGARRSAASSWPRHM